jgi:hypothetical protein
MDNRLGLHELLVGLMVPNKVYFQPPSSIKLTYPCIIYELATVNVWYANSEKYSHKTAYTVTVIDQNPESELFDAIFDLRYCKFDRAFVSDNLNHFVFTLFY